MFVVRYRIYTSLVSTYLQCIRTITVWKLKEIYFLCKKKLYPIFEG